jgi:hypothetical protein
MVGVMPAICFVREQPLLEWFRESGQKLQCLAPHHSAVHTVTFKRLRRRLVLSRSPHQL